ncbi:MAG: hypothetical protein HDQ96_00675 [Lachnospiraceae bacterium]|nr:hypothetical protein [Lachnospiraceae bacterium]
MNTISLLMGMLFLMPYYYVIQQFNYNTVSQWLTILAGVLLYGACIYDSKKRKIAFACLAGIVETFSVFAHPLSAMGTIFFCFLLIVFSHKKKSVLMYFVATGIITTLIVSGVIGGLAGFDHLIYGIGCYLARGTSVGRTSQEKWTQIWSRYGRVWIISVLCLGFIFLCSFLFHLFRHEKKFRTDICNAVLFSLLVLTLHYFKVSGFEYYTAVYTLGAIFFLMAMVMIPIAKDDKFYWFMAIPPIIFCLTEIAMTKNSGPTERMYFVFASFLGLIPPLYNNISYLKKGVLMLLVLCLTAGQLIINSLYVYRDAPMDELVYAVKEGIFKGIYTTEQNAEDIVELETFIHENTSKEEWIKFMDNVPVGYLFSDGRMCDIRTWDDMNYTYNKNNPTKMYKYFINRETIPDKLIYVDYGRDEQLSIEDENWKFNEFVWNFYEFNKEFDLNETFRVKIYLKKQEVSFEDYLLWAEIKLEG